MSDRKQDRRSRFRTAIAAWALVNGPCGGLLIAAQIFGLPSGLYLAAILLHIALFPGMQLWDVGTRWLGLSGMPSWYYAFAFPCGVVAMNLAAYVGCGAAIHWLGKLLAMRADRRSDPIAEPLGLGRRS